MKLNNLIRMKITQNVTKIYCRFYSITAKINMGVSCMTTLAEHPHYWLRLFEI